MGGGRISRLALGLALALALAAAFVAGVLAGRSGGAGRAAVRSVVVGERAGEAGDIQRGADLGPAPTWTLTDQRGRRVHSSEFDGKVQVVTFLFPYCTTYCPLIAAHLRGLESTLRSAGLADRVQFVAFNVDPRHTGPAQMRAFLSQYGWDPVSGRFEYLTGSPAEVRRVVRDGYHVDYHRVEARGEGAAATVDTGGGAGALAPQPRVANALADSAGVTYDVVHNDGLAIVGPGGRIRRYYAEADRIPDSRLLVDIRALVGGRGG